MRGRRLAWTLAATVIAALVSVTIWGLVGSRRGPAGMVQRELEVEGIASSLVPASSSRGIAVRSAISEAGEIEFAEPSVVIEVRTVGDRIVSDASLQAVRGDRIVWQGRSDEGGTSRVEALSLAGTSLFASHRDHSTEAIQLGHDVPARIVFRLGPGARICGRVNVTGGGPIPPHTRVVAVPSRHKPSPLVGLSREGSDPRVLTAYVDPDGCFCLHGALPLQRYRLYVGAPGWACPAPRANTRAGSGEVELELARVFGLRVYLVDSEGGKPLTDSSLDRLGGYGMLGAEWPGSDPTVKRLRMDEWVRHLAEIPEDEFDSPDPHTISHWYFGPGDRANVGPIGISVHLPGYARVQASLFLHPLDGPYIPTREILLPRVSAGWGDLQVVGLATGDLTPVSQGFTLGAHAALKLQANWDPGDSLTLHLHDIWGPGGSTHQVPWGEYQWTFEALDGTWFYPQDGVARSVTIGTEAARIDVRAPPSGRLHVELRDAHGLPHRSHAILRLSQGSTRDHILAFRSAPYVVHALPEGRWIVGAMTGEFFMPPGSEPFRGETQIIAGSESLLVLSMK